MIERLGGKSAVICCVVTKFLSSVGLAVKEESVWRRGRTGEEAASVREDGSWRRDSVARSDGAWRKTKAGDEVVGTIKDEKLERHEQMCERDDQVLLLSYFTWRKQHVC